MEGAAAGWYAGGESFAAKLRGELSGSWRAAARIA